MEEKGAMLFSSSHLPLIIVLGIIAVVFGGAAAWLFHKRNLSWHGGMIMRSFDYLHPQKPDKDYDRWVYESDMPTKQACLALTLFYESLPAEQGAFRKKRIEEAQRNLLEIWGYLPDSKQKDLIGDPGNKRAHRWFFQLVREVLAQKK